MPNEINKDPYPFLNFLRWISALIVTFGHVYLFWINPTSAVNRSVFESALFFLSSLRGGAVIIFFGISGFLIGGGISVSDPFSIKSYLISRLSRIYSVLMPALILTLLLDFSGRTFFDAQVYGQHWVSGVFGVDYPDKHRSLINLLAPILAIPYFVAPYGSNGALWSLAYEMLFYIVAPICFFRGFLFKTPFFPVVLFFILFYLVFGLDSAIYWFYWCLGAILRKFTASKTQVIELIFISIFVFVLVIFVDGFLMHTNQISRLPLFIGIFLFFFSPFVVSLNFLSNFSRFFSGFSFSLYVIHMPLMYFLGSIASNYRLLTIGGNEFSLYGLLAVFVIILISLFVSFLFSLIFEQKLTRVVRENLSKLS